MQLSTLARVESADICAVALRDTFLLDSIDFGRVKAVFGFLNYAHTSEIGDLYNLYIMLALAYVDPKWIADGALIALRPLGLNLLKLSEMTGIPRETVRRRLKSLIDLGLVDTGRERTYLLTTKAAFLKGVLSNLTIACAPAVKVPS